MSDVCLLMCSPWLNLESFVCFFALTVHEFRAIFFVLSQYLIDCFPVMKHWISKEASKQT